MKKYIHLIDGDIADDEENITEPKKKRKQKFITVSPSSKDNGSSYH